jgi:hypothetical protein
MFQRSTRSPSTGFPILKLDTPDPEKHFVMKSFIICPEEAERRSLYRG